VFDALEAMDAALDEASRSGRAGARSAEDADGMRTNAYNKALAVRDDFFHAELYDWYLSRGRTDQLLEVRPPLPLSPLLLFESDLALPLSAQTDSHALSRRLPRTRADNAREERPPVAVLRPHGPVRSGRPGSRLARRISCVRPSPSLIRIASSLWSRASR